MKNRFITAALLFIILFSSTIVYALTTVRGRVNRGVYPAAYVQVTLWSQRIGRSAPTYTGQDGMYYLYNIPPGLYTVELWCYKTPRTYTKIRIPPNLRNYDIPPLQINW